MKKTITSLFLLIFITSFVNALEPDVWGRIVLTKIKAQIKQQSQEYMPAYNELKKFCDEELGKAPYSVMDKKLVPPSGNKHDYVSMGRYWWPDPTKPDGLPYIRKDGQSNPELELLDRNRMGKMMNAVSKLSLMYFYSEEEKYAKKATSLLRTWFLNEDTKMNPDMQFGQYIPGRNNNKGRAEGLIDTYGMVEMLSGVTYLKNSKSFTDTDLIGLQEWFGNFLDWMLTSEIGIAEQKAANNHAVAYDVQVVAYAQFIGRDDLAKKTLREFPEKRIFTQVKSDGSQPKELARTTGFGYSVFNINHMLDMCMLAGESGKELFQSCQSGKSSIGGAISYMYQFLGKPQSDFPYEQIKEWDGVQNSLAWILLRSTYFEPNPAYVESFKKNNTSKPSNIGYLMYSF